jgi:glutamate carboxypeptidase
MDMTVQNYFNHHLPGYLDILRQMVEINSFTANSAGVNRLSEYTASVFSNLGLQPEFIPSINPKFGKHLFLQPESQDTDPLPTIAMISHLDTVFPPEEEQLNDFIWRVEGERAYGPGTVDIKGGTVMIYIVLDGLRLFAPEVFKRVRWLICLDASEETLSEDFGKLCLERLPDASTLACLVFEGGTPNPNAFPIVTARKGRAEFRITAEGRGAHAGNYHKQGANAIVQLARTIQEVATFTDYTNNITFNTGFVRGGSVVNRVPHFAEAMVEMRSFDPGIFEEGVVRMLSLDGGSQISSFDGFPCRVRVELISSNPPWPRNTQTDRLFNLWSDSAASYDYRLIPEQRGGLSDGNLLWNSHPTLDGLGPTGNNAHCSERSSDGSKEQEYVLISSFVPKALVNYTAITRLVKDNTRFG